MLPENADSCKRIFQQAGSRRKARLGETLHARVAMGHRAIDALKVKAIGLGEHVKLVGNREIHIAPAIREQLGQLCLQR